MSLSRKIRKNIISFLGDNINQEKLEQLALSEGVALTTPNIKSGFVDPFATTKTLPLIYVHHIKRGEYDPSSHTFPLDFMIMYISNEYEAEDKGEIFSDLLANLFLENGSDIDGILDIEGITSEIYLGGGGGDLAKQKVVVVLTMTIHAFR